MATKPTDLPEWATDPGADITEPPVGKKAAGWTALEKPPAQWFNWFFNLVYQWIIYLNDLTIGTIEVGVFGEFEITVDTAPAQTLKYQTTGAPGSGDMTFETEYVKCLKSLIASNITPLGGPNLNIGDLTLNPKRLFVAEVNSLLINTETLSATEPIESPNTPEKLVGHWRILSTASGDYSVTSESTGGLTHSVISSNNGTVATGAPGMRTVELTIDQPYSVSGTVIHASKFGISTVPNLFISASTGVGN